MSFKATRPKFHCRHVPRARRHHHKKITYTIVNNYFLGNNQFVCIDKADINQYNYYKNEYNVAARFDDDDKSVRLFKNKNYYPTEYKGMSKDTTESLPAITNDYDANTIEETLALKYEKEPDDRIELWKGGDMLIRDKRELMYNENRDPHDPLSIVSKRFENMALAAVTNADVTDKTCAKLLSQWGKVLQNNMLKKKGPGRIDKKVMRMPKMWLNLKNDHQDVLPVSSTSTPFCKRKIMISNKWEVSPIKETTNYSDKRDCKEEENSEDDIDTIRDNEIEQSDSNDDIFDISLPLENKCEDANDVTEEWKSIEQNLSNETDPSDYVDTDETDQHIDRSFDLESPHVIENVDTDENYKRIDESKSSDRKSLNSIENYSYVTSASFVENSSMVVSTMKAVETSGDEDDVEKDFPIHKSLSAFEFTDNNFHFSSDEEAVSTEHEVSSVQDGAAKGYDDGEWFLDVVPGKKWRRSLMMMTTGNRNRITHASMMSTGLNATKSNWTIRVCNDQENALLKMSSFNPLSQSSSVENDPRKTLKNVEYDSFVSDGFFNNTETNEELLNWTFAVHQRATDLLETNERTNTERTKYAGMVLDLCEPTSPVDFNGYVAKLKVCKKIGEGIYGEVYLVCLQNEQTVLKVIPIEGGEDTIMPQRTYREVFSEICIALSLSNLKNVINGNYTNSFCSMAKITCLKGAYPAQLVKVWNKYTKTTDSENESPRVYGKHQLYVALEMLPGGDPVESYVFCSARQSYSVLLQTIHALAAAEQAFEFEHRDLHWGNILVSKTSEKSIDYIIGGVKHSIQSYGRKATIIDYTLSRIRSGKFDIYNDLESDKEIFQAFGDHQFEVYRDMRKDVEQRWERFEPKTNVRWLHYLAAKCYKGVYYKSKHKVHRTYLLKIKRLRDRIINYASATQVVENLVSLA